MARSQSTGRQGLDRRGLLKYAGAAAALAVAGCSSDDGDGGSDPTETTTGEMDTPTQTTELQPRSGGTMRVGFEAELTGLDPHNTSSVVSWVVVFNLCETLITFENREAVGRLATSWDISDDGLEYTFTLKEGVQFHPPVSREMTAEDVVYSFERMNQSDAMGGDLAALDTVEATDDYEVTFTLANTFAPFFNFLARVPWVVVPEEAVEDQGGELGDFQEPVGTGPFVMGEYQQGNFLELNKFDEYHVEEVPYLDTVRVEPVPDADSRVSALRSGDIDMARNVPGNNAGTLKEDENTELLEEEATGWAQIHINCSQSPWDNPAVRRAVAHVVKRQDIVDAGVFGYGTASWQPYPEESIWNFDLGDSPRRRDLEKAQQILDEAGNPLEGKTLSFKTNTSYQIMKSTADLIVAELNAAGIDAETNVIEWGTQLGDFVSGNFGAMAFSVPFKIDPDRHYYGFLHPSTSQWNKYGEEQPDAQRMYELVQQGRDTLDQSARVETYSEFQQLVNKNVPWISIARTDDLMGVRSDIQGYRSWLFPYTRYWRMWTEQ